MNLLKAQDLKKKIEAVDFLYTVEMKINTKTNQQELVISSDDFNRTSLPQLVNLAGELPYIVEPNKVDPTLINFIIF